MSIECGECERDLRGPHAPGCSNDKPKTKKIPVFDAPSFEELNAFLYRQEALSKSRAAQKKLGHCCPHCGGTQGYKFTMNTDHIMITLGWTKDSEAECAADTRCKVSLFECLDCGAKMRESTVEAIRDAE